MRKIEIENVSSKDIFKFLFEISDCFGVVFCKDYFTLSEKKKADSLYEKYIQESNQDDEIKRILLDKFYCGAEGMSNYQKEYLAAVKSYQERLSECIVDESVLNAHLQMIGETYYILHREVSNVSFFHESWDSYVKYFLKIDEKLKQELLSKENFEFATLKGFRDYISEYTFYVGERLVFGVVPYEKIYLEVSDSEYELFQKYFETNEKE